jgi:acyl-CoA ligase (AMP-forming) (exosortase A-associated)
MDHLTHHLLRASTQRDPDGVGLVQGDRRLTYGDLERATDRLAHAFVAAGVERLDRVAVFLEKSVEETLAIVAASKAGGVFVPINHLLFPEQVEHILRDCTPKVLVTSRTRLATLAEVIRRVPGLRAVVVTDGGGEAPPAIEQLELPGVLGDGAAPAGPPRVASISPDLAAILYTSGSTGKPKGVMLSHANLLAGSRIVSTYLEITESDRILSVLPFSFDYGLNQLLTGLERRARVILLTFRFPGEVVSAIRDEEATGLAGVPSFWTVLSQPGSPVHRQPLPSLRYITNSGGAVPRPLYDALRKALPTTRIFLMYGLTEAFRSTYLPPEDADQRPGSMGKAIPDCEIFVVDEHGKPCRPGEPGELVHRGPTVSLGYWGLPEATAKVLRPNPLALPQIGQAETVCYSGDIVKMDEDGFLYFVGRRDATIKCAGHRISPTEVEEILIGTRRVREAAAIGVPDALMGQAVLAVVVAQDGEPLDVDALLGELALKMPRYMVPRRVEIVPNLPKTAHGKIDYPALRRQYT